MNFCIPYNKRSNFKYYNEITEYNLDNFDPADTTFPIFLKENENKQINIRINHDLSIEYFDLINKMRETINPNIKIIINYLNKPWLKAAQENNFPFIFSNHIDNWDDLNGYINENPSEVYIIGDLCFDLIEVRSFLQQRNIKIRTFPNIVHTRWKINTLTAFYIRADDIDLYSSYFDTFEFQGSPDKYNIYYQIYAKDKTWWGNIGEYIIGLEEQVDNRALLSMFGPRRIDCQRKCLKHKGCKICYRIAELSDTLVSKGLELEKIKDN